MSWAGQRRAVYFFSTVLALIVIVGVPIFLFVHETPTCFDENQNGNELGVDCGGACQQLCALQVSDPVVRWSRSFEVTPNNYSAVAYIENPNPKAAVTEANYAFRLFDKDGLLIAERSGSTPLLPNRVTPVFASNINSENRVVSQTFFEFTDELTWLRAEDRSSDLTITDRVLSRPDQSPRLDATLENTSVGEFTDIDIVAVIFGTDGNAVAASKTFIDLLPRQAKENLVFTWPLPLPKKIESCKVPADVMLLLDVSGSMNDDGGDPPQPLTSAKEAAAAFVNRLENTDRSGVATFATISTLLQTLTSIHASTREALLGVSILPEEESGETNAGEAIIEADLELRSARHNTDAKKIAVFLTDGKANAPEEPGGEEYALEQAAISRENDVLFYTIGLGEGANQGFLRDIAGSEARTFFAASSNDLDGIYREISAAICERGAASIDIIPVTKDAFLIEGEMR